MYTTRVENGFVVFIPGLHNMVRAGRRTLLVWLCAIIKYMSWGLWGSIRSVVEKCQWTRNFAKTNVQICVLVFQWLMGTNLGIECNNSYVRNNVYYIV